MPGISKATNEYQQVFGALYDKTPKAVFAAVAFSLAFKEASENTEYALAGFIEEWRILHENGIVPQKPPKEAVHA